MPYVNIDDARYFYQLSSPPVTSAEMALILLHGSGGDSSVWEEQLRGLGLAITVIAPDLPGHGKSGGSCFTAVADYTAWLDTFVKRLRINTCFLLGHSLGSAIAQDYGRCAPQTVRGLILTGSGTHFVIAKEYLKTVIRDFPAAVHQSCLAAYAPEHISLFYERGYALLSQNGKQALYNDLVACAAFNSRAWVSSLHLPVLAICGNKDTITPPHFSEALVRTIPGARLNIIVGAGHMVMMEAAGAFNEAIKTFVRYRL